MSKKPDGAAAAVAAADGYELYKAYFARLQEDKETKTQDHARRHDYVAMFLDDMKAELTVQRVSFVKLGKSLCGLYELPLGYLSYCSGNGRYKKFIAFCREELGLKETTVHNYMAVAQRYGERDADGKLTGRISPAFERYTYTALAEMLPIKKVLPPSATRRDIQDAKKALREQLQHVEVAKSSRGDEKKGDAPEYRAGDPELRKAAIEVAALPCAACDELVVTKNAEARRAFLAGFESWPLFLDVPAMRTKVYRCGLSLAGKYIYCVRSVFDDGKPQSCYYCGYYISGADGFSPGSCTAKYSYSALAAHLTSEGLGVFLPRGTAAAPAPAPASVPAPPPEPDFEAASAAAGFAEKTGLDPLTSDFDDCIAAAEMLGGGADG
jgi:hypothetical protein